MNEKTDAVVIEHAHEPLSLGKYVAGFAGSIAITVLAYVLATGDAYSKDVVVGLLAGLAVVQFIVQMMLFLHVGNERKPRWKLMIMWLMLGVVIILVAGSIWIMAYRPGLVAWHASRYHTDSAVCVRRE
jgi:cytochrome o ubiquinol oxidase operon protein cyoD